MTWTVDSARPPTAPRSPTRPPARDRRSSWSAAPSTTGRPPGRWPPPWPRDFTTYGYDRRGRGDSGDTAPYAVQREIEDRGGADRGGRRHGVPLRALLRRDPRRPYATAERLPIAGLALFEPPFQVGPEGGAKPEHVGAADRAGRPRAAAADAVELFLTARWGCPPRPSPGCAAGRSGRWLEGLAHTLAYDATVTVTARCPPPRLATITHADGGRGQHRQPAVAARRGPPHGRGGPRWPAP